MIVEFEMIEHVCYDSGHVVIVPKKLVEALDHLTDECLMLPHSFISVCTDLLTLLTFALHMELVSAEDSILLLSSFTDLAERKDMKWRK